MMDEQSAEHRCLKADLEKVQAENEELKPALKEAQENLIALENYIQEEKICVLWISPRVEVKIAKTSSTMF